MNPEIEWFTTLTQLSYIGILVIIDNFLFPIIESIDQVKNLDLKSSGHVSKVSYFGYLIDLGLG